MTARREVSGVCVWGGTASSSPLHGPDGEGASLRLLGRSALVAAEGCGMGLEKHCVRGQNLARTHRRAPGMTGHLRNKT